MRTLFPLLLSAFWADLDRPFLDQETGLAPFPEWSNRFYLPSIFERPTSLDVVHRNWADILRSKDHAKSIITADKDNFQLILDLKNFKKEEIQVKVDKRVVTVEAKHEEGEDKKSTKMHLCQKYFVPEQVDIELIKSTLSTDGILMITAPIKKESDTEKKEILIPIEETGKPAITEKSEEATKDSEKKEKESEEVTVETLD